MPFAAIRMVSEDVMLSKINHTEKDKYYMICLDMESKKKKMQQTSEYNKNEAPHRYRAKASGYQ